MLKDFFIKETECAVNKAIENGKLGQMGINDEYTLVIEKPKNPDFGDFAINVSSLARVAKIAPPMIANAIVEFLPQKTYTVSVVGGFINFKIKEELLADIIEEILEKGVNYGKNQVTIPLFRTFFDFLQPKMLTAEKFYKLFAGFFPRSIEKDGFL